MKDFIKLFERNHAGLWTCIQDGEFNGPNGRIQVTVGSRFSRGTSFMGIDLAEWLDKQYRKDQQPPH